jgi:hypothetical protein
LIARDENDEVNNHQNNINNYFNKIKSSQSTSKPSKKSKSKPQLRNNKVLYDIQQQQAKKQQYQKFLDMEKEYFDKLGTIQNTGQANFKANSTVRQVRNTHLIIRNTTSTN